MYNLVKLWSNICILSRVVSVFAGWRGTSERKRTFQFTNIFSKEPTQVFATLPGNPGGFDWRDVTGKNIGFSDGLSSNEHCLAKASGDLHIVVIV